MSNAVNAWLPPRLTGYIDLTIAADRAGFARLAERLAEGFMSSDRRIVIEIQAAKTPFPRGHPACATTARRAVRILAL